MAPARCRIDHTDFTLDSFPFAPEDRRCRAPSVRRPSGDRRRGDANRFAQLRCPAGRRAHLAAGRSRHLAAAGRVRRRRHHRAVHQSARSGRAPVFRAHRGTARLGALPDPARRRAAPVRPVRDCAPGMPASRHGRAASAATTFRSASSSKAPTLLPYADAQYTMLGRLTRALRRRYPIARRRRPQRDRPGAQDRSRARVRLGALPAPGRAAPTAAAPRQGGRHSGRRSASGVSSWPALPSKV